MINVKVKYIGKSIISTFCVGVENFTNNKIYDVVYDFRDRNGCLIVLDDCGKEQAILDSNKDFELIGGEG